MDGHVRNRRLLVIKVGGGLVTDKTRPFTPQPERIALFAAELDDFRDTYPGIDCLAGNGVGSFAHFSAHEYGLREGAADSAQLYGMCVTHGGATRINGMVVDAMVAAGLPAFALSPASLFTCKNGTVVTSHMAPVRRLLEKKCIPVVYGDTICDSVLGTKILSTEDVLMECMVALREQYDEMIVVYLLASDGLVNENGTRIPRLRADDDISVNSDLQHDVTGGIAGKIERARKAARIADKVYLLNGSVTGELRKVFTTGNVGTKIEP